MDLVKHCMEGLFALALVMNALLFIPQALRLYKTRSSQGLSLFTFGGFLLIQGAILVHGLIHQDYLLSIGYLLSILSCGTVVVLIFLYHNPKPLFAAETFIQEFPGFLYWTDTKGRVLGSNLPITKDRQTLINTGNSAKISEYSLPTTQGIQHYLCHQSPLHNEAGEITGFLGLCLDITEIKKISLQRLAFLEQIIAWMPGHVYWVDAEGFYLGSNNNQAQSAGLSSRQEIVGKKNRDLPWNFNVGSLPETLDKTNLSVMQTRKPLVLEEPALLRDGTELIFLSHKVPMMDPQGEILGLLGISIDITERKKMEQALLLEKNKAEAANQAKTEFLENMRHDIRTALTGIVGISDLFERENNIPKIHEMSTYLSHSAHELLRFLNEVLDSIEVANGYIPLVEKPFKFYETLKNLIALHQPLALKKGLTLQLNYDPVIPLSLIGDPIRIYRIVLELLANALKFTLKGKVSISTELAKKEAQKLVLKLWVRDTGIGIPVEKQAELFLPFKRLSPSSQGIYQGLGLGLSAVKQFMDDIQGEIYLSSVVDQGTEVLCIIPLQEPLLKSSSCIT
jgi:two-component system, OmpR family, aerobic respiration control sensor histidine kinase ArcB